MTKKPLRWKTGFFSVAVLLLMFWGWQRWQGPVVTGYIVESAPLLQHVVATGRVVANSRTQVGSELTAVVLERRVKEGDIVKKGDVLLTLRADTLKARAQEAQAALELLATAQRPQAQAALARAESQLSQARRELNRRKALLASRAVTPEDVEQSANAVATALAAAQQARLDAQALAPAGVQETILQERLAAAVADLEKTTLRAQSDGTVLTRHVEPGDLVQPGRVLLTLSVDNTIELLVPVDERNLGVLDVGQPAVAITDAWPDRPFNAVITSIAPAIDPERGTVDVRLAPDPAPGFLRHDLTVTVTVTTGQRDNALVVPNDALKYDVASGQTRAWRINNNIAQEAVVETGLKGQTLTEITRGLEDGDAVARRTESITPGKRVRFSARPLPGLEQRTGGATHGETPMKFN